MHGGAKRMLPELRGGTMHGGATYGRLELHDVATHTVPTFPSMQV